VAEYTDSMGRVWVGTAPPEAIEEHCAWQRREPLGAEIRARREACARSLRQTARHVGRSHAWLSRIETGDETPGADALLTLARYLGADSATRDRWLALAGHVAPDVEAALLAAPERWDAVRALLAGGDRG